MHYKNGRPAKAGDTVVCLDQWNKKVGVVYDLNPGATTCNARIAPISSSDVNVTLKDCLHIDDIKAADVPAPIQAE